MAMAQGGPRQITLDEAFALSVKRSETLAISAASYKEAVARIDELASAIKPSLSFLASEMFQDTPNTNTSSGSTNSFGQRTRPQVNFNARQPLFTGFREFLAYKAAKRQSESAQFDLQRAQDLLYQDVAQAYLNLLSMQKEISIRMATQDISSKRIKELKDWEKIGRSRRSEVLAAETQLAQLDADLTRAKSLEAEYQETLQFLTGLDEQLLPQDVSYPAMESVDTFLSDARMRPDVQARDKDYTAAKLNTSVYRRARWPVIAADGNYYLKRPSGFQQDIKWDATLSLNLPLYTGGVIPAQTKAAKAQEEAAEQNLSLARRRAESEVRTAAQDLSFALTSAQALDKAEKLAEDNIKAQEADYRHGLVTNLEVLSTVSSLQDIRLNLNQTTMAAVFDRVRLDVAAGRPSKNATGGGDNSGRKQ